ncbi:MAG TPA: clan AA aspartic protease [Planctomycetaceae bacterium]|nr:clan AA aspartic protease [Planctomycetaceae bacterium]
MESGLVTAFRTIVVPVEVLDDQHNSLFIDAMIDTGFNGNLTLPVDVLNSLGAKLFGTRLVELADGSLVQLDSYLIVVKWFGNEGEVLAIESESEPLLGMSMLWGSRVSFDAVDGGALTIEEIA